MNDTDRINEIRNLLLEWAMNPLDNDQIELSRAMKLILAINEITAGGGR